MGSARSQIASFCPSGQIINILDFHHERLAFDSFQRRSTSPLDNHQLTIVPFPKAMHASVSIMKESTDTYLIWISTFTDGMDVKKFRRLAIQLEPFAL